MSTIIKVKTDTPEGFNSRGGETHIDLDKVTAISVVPTKSGIYQSVEIYMDNGGVFKATLKTNETSAHLAKWGRVTSH
jgi:hypothetical protein